MKGRKPVPTTLKLLHGNPGKRAINHDEPVPGAELPDDPPKWLDERAAGVWREMVAELVEMGMSAAIDGPALAAYCAAVSRMVAAEELVQRDGLTVRGSHGGITRNPAVGIAKDAAAQVHKLAAEFGFTPSSRTRIKVPKKPKSENAFGQFLSKAE